MAKQKGIIKIKGSIGDISFYKTRNGHLAREKGGIDGNRIKRDPRFRRTRENGAEFGSAAREAKLIRNAIAPVLQRCKDSSMNNRLAQLLMQVRQLDTVNVRGERHAGAALQTPEARLLLSGFSFNARATLGSVVLVPPQTILSSGTVQFPAITMVNGIVAPPAATHVSFTAASVAVNFDEGSHLAVYSPDQIFALSDTAAQSLVLTAGPQPLPGLGLLLLEVRFSQEINGTLYDLRDGQFNSLTIMAAGWS